MSRLNN